ncbi:MAG: hypothetical protein LZF62_480319 [Nitrospira sp.]|nr:MAG: hypothetical protein LZF62_480319 [Nitrospira sp.]
MLTVSKPYALQATGKGARLITFHSERRSIVASKTRTTDARCDLTLLNQMARVSSYMRLHLYRSMLTRSPAPCTPV